VRAAWLGPNVVPLALTVAPERTQDTAASIDPVRVESRRQHDAAALSSRSMTQTGERLGSLATLNGGSPLELPNRQQERPRNVAQVRRQAQGGEPV